MSTPIKRSRNLWPVTIIVYFILFFTFTVSIVCYLSRQKMDLVRGDYYDDEIRYQEQLDRMNRTRSFTAEVSVSYDVTRQSISICLPPAHAQMNAIGRIHLYRPSDESLDQDLKLAIGPDGIQRVDAKGLQDGLWKVRVYWTANAQDYFFGKTIIIGNEAKQLAAKIRHLL